MPRSRRLDVLWNTLWTDDIPEVVEGSWKRALD